MKRLYSIAQARDAAAKRLPRFALDFLEGGAGREFALQDNEAGLARLTLIPRILRGIDKPDLATTLFGRRYAAPFGIAPMGLPSIAWPGADIGLAHASSAGNVPFVLSTAASITIGQAMAAAPETSWFQLYPSKDEAWTSALVDEAEAAGVDVLMLTVDRPLMGWRVRDLTNGVGLQFKFNARAAAGLVAHPRWSLATLRAGKPVLAYPPPPANADSPIPLNWAFVSALRKRWRKTLVIKGLLHPDDARMAVAHGADGVVVSNHGGAHLESAPASIAQLPLIRDAVGQHVRVLADGGIRNGEDIVKALALGADFVLLGRAFAYGVAALGPEHGPHWTINLLREGLMRTLPLIGCSTVADIQPAHVAVRSPQHIFGALSPPRENRAGG